MKSKRMLWVVLALCLVLVLVLGPVTAASAGEFSGAQYFGIRGDGDEVAYLPGITLDYEILPEVYVTLDVQARYKPAENNDITARYDLGLNVYPGWIFEECVLSIGGVSDHDRVRYWYIEVARPFR